MFFSLSIKEFIIINSISFKKLSIFASLFNAIIEQILGGILYDVISICCVNIDKDNDIFFDTFIEEFPSESIIPLLFKNVSFILFLLN